MNRHTFISLIIALGTVGAACAAVTPAELRDRLARGDRVTLIDLRPRDAYEAGTLPNAVRMTAREATQKPLTGEVIFFDDGTGPNLARRAAAQLAEANSNVSADTLAGGYAAWCDAGGQTSEAKGLRPALTRYVSYQEVTGDMTEDAADIVLVDLRPAPPRAPAAALAAGEGTEASATPAATAQPRLDLASELPGYSITRTIPGTRPQRGTLAIPVANEAQTVPPLYVLIDAGDGTAERTAQTLRAAGISRVAILAGGETIIRRKGEPGLLRRGPGTGLADDASAGNTGFATIIQQEEQP
jgi:rhodanese-related sulfurtransferase